MHSKIVAIYNVLKDSEFNDNPLSSDALNFLKNKEITATEAAIMLSEMYKISDEDIQRYVYNSGIWAKEKYDDIMRQTLIYLFGGDENVKENNITIRLK